MGETLHRPVKVGIVGLGFAGVGLHLTPLKQNPRAEIVAVSDEEPDKISRLHNENPELTVQAYPSGKELIEKADCDAIFICTPTPSHLPLTELAMKTGRHVFCEKPVANNAADAHAMHKLANEYPNQILMIGQVLRFWPEYVEAHKLVKTGQIGRPSIARASRAVPMPTGWYAREEISGGVILDLMLHDIDFLYWTLGPVASVFAQGNDCLGKGEPGFVDYAQVHLNFESGAIAHLEASWAVPSGFPFSTELEISGSDGMLTMNNRDQQNALRCFLHNEPEFCSNPAEFNGYFFEDDAFLRAVQHGDESPIALSDVLQPLEVALAAKESIRTGEIIPLLDTTKKLQRA